MKGKSLSIERRAVERATGELWQVTAKGCRHLQQDVENSPVMLVVQLLL